VLVFLCFYVLWRTRRQEWPRWGFAIAGGLAGLAVAAEYTAALGLIPLAAYALWTAPGGASGKARAALFGLAGLLPAALALAGYHWAAFGHPLHTGYQYLNDAAYQGWHVGGFLGIKLPDPRALALSFFSPLRGLFALAPFLVLALPGFSRAFWTREHRPELAVSLATLALSTYFTSSFSYESWGWTTGPRHLAALVPFLLLPVALFVQAGRERFPLGGLAAGLAALSILSTSAMTFLNYIPDSLTNGLYQVAWPFLASGHLPHTWLSLLGVPNPWAAVPAIAAIVAAVGLSVTALLPERQRATSAVVAAALLALVAGVHASLRPVSDLQRQRDEATYRFLEERYVPRPGQASANLWAP
jgi:hypothetical protein